MNQLSFNDLVSTVKVELLRLKYKEQRINLYESVWEALGHYMKKRNLQYFDMKTGLNFLEDEYGITVFKHLSSSNGIYVPHIFTQEQLKCFFTECENIKLHPLSNKHLVLPAIYRLLYGCGLRISEAVALKLKEQPHALYQYQQILAIPMKKARKKSINYLTLDAVKNLLDMPDKTTKSGRRDLVLLSLIYDSGARVQEIADIRVADVRLHPPATVKLTGKGNKTRIVPPMEPMAKLLEQYLKENKLNLPQCNEYPLFQNSDGKKLTRSGISFILKKYFKEAKKLFPECFPDTISPHVMRHSKAMHLLQSGVNLVYIRDLLGHVNIQTTEIYARADSSMKRKALEDAYADVVSDELPEWQKNADLLEWLQNLGR